MNFRTHTGELVTGPRLEAACQEVGTWYENNAHAIRREDHYASHVTEETKGDMLARGLAHAAAVKAGDISSFAVWQRINMALTGECVAFLPK